MTPKNLLARQRRIIVGLQLALGLFFFAAVTPAFAQLQIVSRFPRLDEIRATPKFAGELVEQEQYHPLPA